MRKAFVGLAALLMFAIFVLFFLAGNGAFNSAPNDEAFRPHRLLGMGTVFLAVVLAVVAAVGRMPGQIIGLTALVAGLAILQPVIVVISKAFGDSGSTTTAGQLVFGLHAVNGLIMMAVLHTILQKVGGRKATTPATTAAGSARSVS
ncbi:DUF6220 domain-containing protein [Micromonospora sp. NPDC049204]|uniref:DUF6220 domain-containing protein n=1 Tax=unclassified Micromonospora TaxID=2617518 RepID=UPI0033F37352